MELTYQTDLEGVGPSQVAGFFDGWPNPPSPGTFLRLLHQSSHLVLALRGQQVVGFIQAISDGVLSAYIPLLEVLPQERGRGIGTELLRRMQEQLNDFYMVDLMCDPNRVDFYERSGFQRAQGMILRRYARQSGVGG